MHQPQRQEKTNEGFTNRCSHHARTQARRERVPLYLWRTSALPSPPPSQHYKETRSVELESEGLGRQCYRTAPGAKDVRQYAGQ